MSKAMLHLKQTIVGCVQSNSTTDRSIRWLPQISSHFSWLWHTFLLSKVLVGKIIVHGDAFIDNFLTLDIQLLWITCLQWRQLLKTRSPKIKEHPRTELMYSWQIESMWELFKRGKSTKQNVGQRKSKQLNWHFKVTVKLRCIYSI